MIPLSRLEISVADHCNMSCRGCHHASPVFPEAFADPGLLAQDLGFLSTLVHASTSVITGGEPLLHPAIDTVLEAVRASGISGQVELSTNGKLLQDMSSCFWAFVDVVRVSSYPGVSPSWPAEYQEKVRLQKIERFKEPFTAIRNPDEALVRRIWDKCGVRNVSFGMTKRHFFKCMRAAHVPRVSGLPPMADGIPLEGLTEKALFAYIRNPEPLESCRRCTGTSGREFSHGELRAEEWSAPLNVPVTELLEPDRAPSPGIPR